jgi:tetratricopeptide (TPR) repeat protein
VPYKANGEQGEGLRLKEMYKEQVSGYPTILFVDSLGKVVEKIGGYMEPDDFAWKMAEILQTSSEDRLQKELVARPGDVGLLARMTVMYAMLQDIGKANEFLNKADKANTAKPEAERETKLLLPAYQAVGGYYFKKKDYETAIPHMLKYRDVVEDPRGRIKSHLALSLAYIETSQADLAVKELETLLKRTDLNPDEKANAEALRTQARKDAGLE